MTINNNNLSANLRLFQVACKTRVGSYKPPSFHSFPFPQSPWSEFRALEELPYEVDLIPSFEAEVTEQDHLAGKYAGMRYADNLRLRACDADSFRSETFSSREREELNVLCKHRRIAYEYGVLVDRIKTAPIESQEDHIRDAVQKLTLNIDSLENERKLDIVHHHDGRKSIPIPMGSKVHATMGQIIRERDGTYTFVMYNKGEGSSSRRLHGGYTIKRNGKSYRRSNVVIRGLSKEAISDPKFLSGLFKLKATKSSYRWVNDHIYRFLVRKHKGRIERPKNEALYLELLQRYDTLSEHEQIRLEELEDDLLKDPLVHSIQDYGTCTESNPQLPEHLLVSSLLRKKLKIYSIRLAIKKATDPALKELAQEKLLRLEEKISHLVRA